jgi:hypothetical protein
MNRAELRCWQPMVRYLSSVDVDLGTYLRGLAVRASSEGETARGARALNLASEAFQHAYQSDPLAASARMDAVLCKAQEQGMRNEFSRADTTVCMHFPLNQGN